MNHILQAQSKDSLCLSSGVLVTQRRRPSVSCSFAPSGRATRRPSPTLTTVPSASRAIRPTTWSASCPAGNHSLRNTSRKCGSKDWKMGIVLCLRTECGVWMKTIRIISSIFFFWGGALFVFESVGVRQATVTCRSFAATEETVIWKRPRRLSWRLHAAAVAGYELKVLESVQGNDSELTRLLDGDSVFGLLKTADL